MCNYAFIRNNNQLETRYESSSRREQAQIVQSFAFIDSPKYLDIPKGGAFAGSIPEYPQSCQEARFRQKGWQQLFIHLEIAEIVVSLKGAAL